MCKNIIRRAYEAIYTVAIKNKNMKIEKLTTTDPLVIANKVNELIDILNKQEQNKEVLLNYQQSLADYLTASLHDKVKCPYCGGAYFAVGPTFTTAVYYAPIYKDGVNINPDHNKSITKYECLKCGRFWEEAT